MVLGAVQQEIVDICCNDLSRQYYYKDAYKQCELAYWYKALPWINNLKNINSVLDVGGAYGTLIMFCKKVHHSKRLVLMDCVPAWDIDTYKKMGIQQYCSNIEIDDVSHLGKFDLIICTEVIEHFNFNPVRSLVKMRELLDEFGHIVLSTPSAESWGRTTKYYTSLDEIPNFTGEKVTFIDDHIWQYTKEELESLFEDANLKIVKYELSEGVNGFFHHCYLLSRSCDKLSIFERNTLL